MGFWVSMDADAGDDGSIQCLEDIDHTETPGGQTGQRDKGVRAIFRDKCK